MVKDTIKLGIILLLICGISTGLLAYVNMVTKPVIAENDIKAQLVAKQEVIPEAATFEEIDENISAGKDKNGNIIGYAVSVKPFGYGGEISMIVGVKSDLTVSGVKILSLSETPGLGAKAQDDNFLSQFNGKNKDMKLKDDIAAISGATVTSTAVTDGVKEAISLVENKGGNK